MAHSNSWDLKRRVKEFMYSGSEDEEIVKIFKSYRKEPSVYIPKKTTNSLHNDDLNEVRNPSYSSHYRNINTLPYGIKYENERGGVTSKSMQMAKRVYNNGRECGKLFEMKLQESEDGGGGDTYGNAGGFERGNDYFDKKRDTDRSALTKWQCKPPAYQNTTRLITTLRDNDRTERSEKAETFSMEDKPRMNNKHLRNVIHNIRKVYNSKEVSKCIELPERNEELEFVDRSISPKRPVDYKIVEECGIPMKIKRHLDRLEEKERQLKIQRQLQREQIRERERQRENEKLLEKERLKTSERQMNREKNAKRERPQKTDRPQKAEQLFELEIWEKPPEPQRIETQEWTQVKGEYPWKHMDEIRKSRTSHVTLWKPKISQNEPPAKWQLAEVEEKAKMSEDVEPKIKFRSTSQTPVTSKARASDSGLRTRSRTFSKERVREIERHNKILLKKILTPKTSIPDKIKKPKLPPPRKATNAAMNRIMKQKQIAQNNFELKKRINAIHFRPPKN